MKKKKLFKTKCNYCGCPIIECPEKEGVIRIFDIWYKINKKEIQNENIRNRTSV
jgi:hypothetical protein